MHANWQWKQCFSNQVSYPKLNQTSRLKVIWNLGNSRTSRVQVEGIVARWNNLSIPPNSTLYPITSLRMAKILDQDTMEALITARAVCSDCSSSEYSPSWKSRINSTSETESYSTCQSASSNCSSPYRSTLAAGSPSSASSFAEGFSRYGTAPRTRSSKNMIMDDRDKTIYNSLGSSSSPIGKVCTHIALNSVLLFDLLVSVGVIPSFKHNITPKQTCSSNGS